MPDPLSVLINVPFPEKLKITGQLSQNWKKFKRVLTQYAIASRLNKQSSEQRVATLLTCIGGDALEIVDSFKYADETDKTDIDKVLEKLEDFCVGTTNEIYERYCFNKRDQLPEESFDAYLSSLRTLSKTCNSGTLEENLIRDRIVVGLKENVVRKRLLQERKLTLKDCIDICKSNGSTAIRLQAMNQEDVAYVKTKT